MLRPRPSIYADECLVFEDTVAGVTAARAAGMHTVAFANSTPAQLTESDLVGPAIGQAKSMKSCGIFRELEDGRRQFSIDVSLGTIAQRFDEADR